MVEHTLVFSSVYFRLQRRSPAAEPAGTRQRHAPKRPRHTPSSAKGLPKGYGKRRPNDYSTTLFMSNSIDILCRFLLRIFGFAAEECIFAKNQPAGLFMEFAIILTYPPGTKRCADRILFSARYNEDELRSFGISNDNIDFNDLYKGNDEFNKIRKLWQDPAYLNDFYNENEHFSTPNIGTI